MSRVGIALGVMLLIGASYEPLRTLLYPTFGAQIGGVGGVGGLTNEWGVNTTDQPCVRYDTSGYCFVPGWALGLTPFAAVFLATWVAPLWLASALEASHPPPVPAEGTDTAEGMSRATRRFLFLWSCASVIWFAYPATGYLLSPYYRESGWTLVLGIALSSAYPLPWHLSLLACSGRPLAVLLGVAPADFNHCHVHVAWCAVFFGVLHAGSEMLFLAHTKLQTITSAGAAECWLYVVGVVATVVLILHAAAALARQSIRARRWDFRRVHVATGRLLLCLAAAHWKPLALFLVPGAAMAATSDALGALDDMALAAYRKRCAEAFAVSLGAGCVAFLCVWSCRETVLTSGTPTYARACTAYVFPPLAAVCAYWAGRAVVPVSLACTRRRAQAAFSATALRDPLLTTTEDVDRQPRVTGDHA